MHEPLQGALASMLRMLRWRGQPASSPAASEADRKQPSTPPGVALLGAQATTGEVVRCRQAHLQLVLMVARAWMGQLDSPTAACVQGQHWLAELTMRGSMALGHLWLACRLLLPARAPTMFAGYMVHVRACTEGSVHAPSQLQS